MSSSPARPLLRKQKSIRDEQLRGYTAFRLKKCMELHINSKSYDAVKYGFKSKAFSESTYINSRTVGEREKIIYSMIEDKIGNSPNSLMPYLLWYITNEHTDTFSAPSKNIFVPLPGTVDTDVLNRYDMYISKTYNRPKKFKDEVLAIHEIMGKTTIGKSLYAYTRVTDDAGRNKLLMDILANRINDLPYDFDTVAIFDKIAKITPIILDSKTGSVVDDLAQRISRISMLYDIDATKYKNIINELITSREN